MWWFLVLSSAAASRIRLQRHPSFASHEPPGKAKPGGSSSHVGAFSAVQRMQQQNHLGGHDPVTDTALNFTCGMDDFMTGAEHWHAKPYVHHSKDDDQADVQFTLLSYDWQSEKMHARDYVRPLPNAAQRQRLLQGPLHKLLRQSGHLARLTVFIHGYIPPLSGGDPGSWPEDAGKLLVQGGRGKDAAVLVDWSHAAFSQWSDCREAKSWSACVDTYIQAMSNTRVVGKYVQRLVAAIHDALETVTISCVGHSLGAHVCGFVGKYLQLEPSPKRELRMARISGLDPAGPASTGEWAEWAHMKTDGSSWTNMEYRKARLSKTDADFVDVYITDPGNDGYNMSEAVEKEARKSVTEEDMLGHVVFLVNNHFYQQNGHMHPGSNNTRDSHAKAVELYKQTLQERAKTAHWLDEQEEEVKSQRAKMEFGMVVVCMLAITFMFYTHWHRAGLILCLLGCYAIGIYYKPPMQDACSYQKPHRVQQCKLPLPAIQLGANGTCEASRAQVAQFGICASPNSADGLLLYDS